MATIEPRVNIALDHVTLSTIKQLADRTKQSVSKICADLIKKQIEYDEDAYYIGLINQMGDIDQKPRISAQEMEQRLNELQD
jgi:predicted DNA-binding protein